MSSSEIFPALFELELANKIRQMPGKNFVKKLLKKRAPSYEWRAAGDRGVRRRNEGFKELKVWQKAHEMTLDVYCATRGFPREELYGLTSQLRRSAASMGANIAEGCGR